uniref:Uncharacterized protein n=1 Tax=Sphaerodactylus townsendi TaxID=933632 RepID=A0ACB8G6N6_9SAUR
MYPPPFLREGEGRCKSCTHVANPMHYVIGLVLVNAHIPPAVIPEPPLPPSLKKRINYLNPPLKSNILEFLVRKENVGRPGKILGQRNGQKDCRDNFICIGLPLLAVFLDCLEVSIWRKNAWLAVYF